MSTVSVSDSRSNAPEQIEFVVKKIGRSVIRRRVFEEVYRGKRNPKTVEEISERLKVTQKEVLNAGKYLADNEIIKQEKKEKKTAYGKYSFFAAHRNEILRGVADPEKLKKNNPTKRSPQVTVVVKTIKVPRALINAKRLFIDDIDSLKPTIPIGAAPVADLKKISEDQFKKGILKLIGDTGTFTDWGGEINDLLSTRVLLKGKRIQAAFAFKGPGKRGILRPSTFGKNVDQIQRLFRSSAELFIVQYWAQIDQAVIEQVESFAQLKSVMDNQRVLFCIIDGQDTQRIVDSNPTIFT